MSKTGRHRVYDLNTKKLVKVVEVISEHPEHGGDWGHTDLSNRAKGGSIEEKDSIVTEENGFKNIKYT